MRTTLNSAIFTATYNYTNTYKITYNITYNNALNIAYNIAPLDCATVLPHASAGHVVTAVVTKKEVNVRAVLIIISILSLLAITNAAQAQDTRYVSDKQYVPLRSGPGNEYRITHRGIPSGTKMSVARTASEGEWSEITTERGTAGWIRSQYLMKDTPAALKVDAAAKRAATAVAKSTELEQQLNVLQAERSTLSAEFSSSTSELDTVSKELNRLKQISGNALKLDTDNRHLVEQTEHLRSELEMLEAENQRLQDKLQSDDFINGVGAILLGIALALLVPRLAPKKRHNSSWA